MTSRKNRQRATLARVVTTGAIELAATPAQPVQPPQAQVLTRPRLSSIGSRAMQTVTPTRIGTALRDLDMGRLEQWCDLFTQAKRDPIVRRAYEIRRIAVAGRAFTCKAPPDIADPVKRRNAEELAALVNRWLLTLDVTFFMRVLDAIGPSISVHELVWSRDSGAYLPTPVQVLTRGVRWETMAGVGPEWSVSVKNADSYWLSTEQPNPNTDPAAAKADTPEQRRARWLIHVPNTEQGRPMDQGQFASIVWPWCFKGKGTMFWLNGIERFGNPFILGRMGDLSDGPQRAQMLEDLVQMTFDSVGVTGGNSDVQVIPGAASGSLPTYQGLLAWCDEQIFIGLGVPPDLVKSGVNGSRAADTVKDGVRVEGSKTDAQLMWDSVTRDCVVPIARYNRFPSDTPMPLIASVFDDATAVPIDAINTGRVTFNQVLAGAGLPPLAEGGDEFYVPAAAAPAYGFSALSASEPTPAASTPAAPATPASGGTPAASPFPTSPLSAGGMPALSTHTPTSPTSSASPTSQRKFARVPRSAGPTS